MHSDGCTQALKSTEDKLKEMTAMVHKVQKTVLQKDAVGLILKDRIQSHEHEIVRLEALTQVEE